MISWPNCRRRMPARARSGLAAARPKTLRCGWRGFPAEQKIRGAEMEETQRMALDDLAEVHQPAQLVGRRRNIDRQDGVAGLGRGQHVAHRANAANARRDAGHFAERPAFAEFFKAAKFDDVKFRVGDVSGVVQKNADFGVALDAGHRIN